MFGKLLSNFRTTVLFSLVLAGVMIYAFGSVAPGGFDLIFWQAVFRWTHVFAGILWIGLLWYFNFVQIRVMPSIPAELKPAVGKHIAPEALFWFRFEPQFGFGAVIGLLHDVILTFGLIVLFRLEFSLNMVAAILTIIGYSMNDTVVVFDRLRENLRKYKTMPLREVIDLSINETLSRTIITGVTAIMVLAALAFLGGPTLFGFSIALMFGIIVGTYSSIYVGAPVILLWGVKRGGPSDDAKPIKLGMASQP